MEAGQFAVLYDGDVCCGGGLIDKALKKEDVV
ncbi:MAG: aminomethyltransferase beta-barrel domain-containing protein [Candidatus Chromulinivorax sp.]